MIAMTEMMHKPFVMLTSDVGICILCWAEKAGFWVCRIIILEYREVLRPIILLFSDK